MGIFCVKKGAKKRKQSVNAGELSMRMQFLKEENANLLVTLEELRGRERDVLSSLAYLKEMQRLKEEELRARYDYEEHRLERYRARWKDYQERLSKSGALFTEVERTSCVLDGLKEEFNGLFVDNGLYQADYTEEKARLSALPDPPDAASLRDEDIKKMLAKLKGVQ